MQIFRTAPDLRVGWQRSGTFIIQQDGRSECEFGGGRGMDWNIGRVEPSPSQFYARIHVCHGCLTAIR